MDGCCRDCQKLLQLPFHFLFAPFQLFHLLVHLPVYIPHQNNVNIALCPICLCLSHCYIITMRKQIPVLSAYGCDWNFVVDLTVKPSNRVLKFNGYTNLLGILLKMQILELHLRYFWFQWSGMGPGNLLFKQEPEGFLYRWPSVCTLEDVKVRHSSLSLLSNTDVDLRDGFSAPKPMAISK